MGALLRNPFVVGGALSDSSGRGFFGREDIFDFVHSSLMMERRVPILLHGQRRIGKSSILKQLPRYLPADFVCVYFDLQGKATMEVSQVLYGLGRAIADAMQGMERPDREDTTEETFPRYLDNVIEHLGGHPERLVLLFDEFDVVDQSLTGPAVAASRFIPYLAELVGSHSGIGYILVVGRKTEEMSSEFFGSILKDTVGKQIGRLKEYQTGQLARNLASGQLEFSSQAARRIYELTNGHPFCAQVLCHVIWNRSLGGRDQELPVLGVDARHVDEALPPALELGSNGLNWIYDGLSKTSHRLVLAAIAEVANPLGNESATLDAIDKELRKRRIAVDETELSQAPRLLTSWDILAKGGGAFSFVVPMIGAWIRENRPLDTLEQQAVLANPRAHRYYELALESLAHDHYDAAIEDFRNALAANPSFLEALRGLATALRRRKKPGDLHLAVEASEQILDLEPGEPAGPLVELLAQSIAAGGDLATVRTRYLRLKELDPDGPFLHRAVRVLLQSAAWHAARRSNEGMEVAGVLYELLGDSAGQAAVARQVWRRRAFLSVLLLIGAVCTTALFDVWSLAGSQGWMVKGAAAALAGALLGVFTKFSVDSGVGFWRISSALFLAIAGGAIGYYFAAYNPVLFALALFSLLIQFLFEHWPAPSQTLADPVTRTKAWVNDPQRALLEGLVATWRKRTSDRVERK
jgi:tetratricopeptide (TPR) repeat protein